MIIIPNVPCKYQDLIKDQSTQFILLHKLMDNMEYAEYYYNNKFDYVILDNSAFELAESLDGDTLMQYAEKFDVDEVIIPDTYGDKDATLAQMEEFITKYGDTDYNFMAVPQGKDQAERLECLAEMLNTPRVDIIGLNKTWERDFNFLAKYIDIIRSKDKQVHFLGTVNLLDWGLFKLLDGVRSADSRILAKMVTGVDDIWEEKLDDTQLMILKNLIAEINGKVWEKPNP